MEAMPRPRPPYLHRFRNRHGTFIWYVRKPGCNRIRIRGTFGTPEFDALYRAAIMGDDAPARAPRVVTGSLHWLWDRYRESGAWRLLSSATRKQRENIMGHVLQSSGTVPYGDIDRADIVAGREKRSATPAQARNFLDAMRGLFRWAVDAEHLKVDPTEGVKNPPRAKGPGFPKWSEAQVEAYEAYWKVGTRQRVWLDVLLYSGLRRGDAVTLGKQHCRDGYFTLRTEKSGQMVLICNPILPVLAATLAAGPCGDLAFICGKNGKPLTKESFGNLFREACDKAGVFGRSAHGLRKVAATRCAENGATESQLMALFGWLNPATAAIYTREANRKMMARAAGNLMQRTTDEQSMCPPDVSVGTPGQKT